MKQASCIVMAAAIVALGLLAAAPRRKPMTYSYSPQAGEAIVVRTLADGTQKSFVVDQRELPRLIKDPGIRAEEPPIE